jgi:predicted transcriptional regulator
MHKRISIRLVDELAGYLVQIAKSRGLSVNSVISEMAWDFVDEWKEQEKRMNESSGE